MQGRKSKGRQQQIAICFHFFFLKQNKTKALQSLAIMGRHAFLWQNMSHANIDLKQKEKKLITARITYCQRGNAKSNHLATDNHQ